MSQADLNREYRRFLDLLPLTLALAGLPPAEAQRSFTDDQLEGRAMVIKRAYKKALQLVRECCEQAAAAARG